MVKQSGRPVKPASRLGNLSDRTKKIVLLAAGSVAVLGGAVWAWYALTTVPPPVLTAAQPEQVTEFLAHPRGFARMSIPQREQFLVETFQRFNSYEDRARLIRSFRQMSPSEVEVVLDATYDVAHDIVMRHAEEYNRRTSSAERAQLVDGLIARFRAMQGELGGGGDPEQNVGEPFKPYMPTSSDELGKMLVTRTSPTERAKAQPLVNAIAKRYQELKQNPRALVAQPLAP